jgi:hypothetical protein
MQTADGILILDTNGALPYGTEVPGTVRIFEGGKQVATRSFEVENAARMFELGEVLDCGSNLGLNMYSKTSVSITGAEAKEGTSSSRPTGFPSSVHASRLMTEQCGPVSSSGKGRAGATSSGSGGRITAASAKAELTMLADLLGVSADASPAKGSGDGSATDAKPFKINLFPDNVFGVGLRRNDHDGHRRIERCQDDGLVFG